MMYAGAEISSGGRRVGPPPDLPSLMLSQRIVYLGTALVPSVSELIVAELLYLSAEGTGDVNMYINSVGTSLGDQIAGFETDVFAIIDTMNFIPYDVATTNVGNSFGTAALILASGEKGKRCGLKNSTVMLRQPIGQVRGQASDIAIKAKEVLNSRLVINKMIAEKTGQTLDQVEKDASRNNYFDAEEAVEYGIIDEISVRGGKFDAAARIQKQNQFQ
jgi:ATP-dependent Clp protease protease subunit